MFSNTIVRKTKFKINEIKTKLYYSLMIYFLLPGMKRGLLMGLTTLMFDLNNNQIFRDLKKFLDLLLNQKL